MKPTPDAATRALLARTKRQQAGSLGGKTRAQNLTRERMSEIASQGGQASIAKYGQLYYRHIRMKGIRKQAHAQAEAKTKI